MSDRLEAAVRELVAAIRSEIEQADRQATPSALLSIEQVAERLGIGRSMVYALVGRGQLRTVKVGRRRVVASDAIDDFVRLAKLGLENVPDRSRHYSLREVRKQRRSQVRMRFPKVGRRDRDFVFERDQWRCGLCHGPIDPALSYPDSDSASIDHIDPFGPHEPSNWQAAHLRCNLRKGDRLSPQPVGSVA